MKTYVIVGGVAGGAGTAARLRRLDEDSTIIIYERGEHISFANCGLPYYVGGTISDREDLFVVTPEHFEQVFNIKVRTQSEVLSIDRANKCVTVKDLTSNKEYVQSYDSLVLSPGAAPVRPPIKGIDDSDIYLLRSVRDVDRIVEKVEQENTKRAVVVGGGFIGLEMAENLKERGLEVTLVEALEQVMNVIDYDLAALVQQHMREKGVTLYLADGVSSFDRTDDALVVTLNSGIQIPTDLVLLSIGVRPDTNLAKEASLAVGPTGAITVDEHFTTSDPFIKAVGDAIEYPSPFTKQPVTIPLAGPANKQARLCADSIVFGKSRPYKGVIGTSIAKVFDLTAASTGMTSKQLIRANIPFKEVITHEGSHAGYYPNATPISIKVLYNPETGELYGGQAVGYQGVDKRIDVLAAFLTKGGTIDDLAEFEQAYAPPFSSAKDPLNMLGFIAQNTKDGLTHPITSEELKQHHLNGALLVDVRSPGEYMWGTIEDAINIPQTSLREKMASISKDRPIVLFCSVGVRGYVAERVLRNAGFTNVYNLLGGFSSFMSVEYERQLLKNT
ncbi:MAG: FAD-dependent oxidoreductase [Sphaerochaetaceae bacterium]